MLNKISSKGYVKIHDPKDGKEIMLPTYEVENNDWVTAALPHEELVVITLHKNQLGSLMLALDDKRDARVIRDLYTILLCHMADNI